ncbi:hypothetical protein MiTs_02082 [Microcystis aeruginosa NIES-2521]|uniref:Uncharacterized protein n=1 Tax=Microcystis aeruginosa NIES-2521 TaxID=2303983 RepID=A0A5A5RZE7_MICAE|nr:hypothetical protein MiTs_02082 [Microcystis aeruginosa NIES-2521]
MPLAFCLKPITFVPQQTEKRYSICGTWEKLADAIYRGGAKELSKLGGASVGQEKTVWAENISPQMNVDINRSPSFGYFRDKLRHLSQEESR